MNVAFLIKLVFSIGFLTAMLFVTASVPAEEPGSLAKVMQRVTGTSVEHASPSDHLLQDQIHVYPDSIIIDVKNATWSRFANTNSMDPLFDATANGIELKPASPTQLKVGDIVSFRTPATTHPTIHRIVEIGFDTEGWFAITKGDNNVGDDGKVRFDAIEGVLVAILY